MGTEMPFDVTIYKKADLGIGLLILAATVAGVNLQKKRVDLTHSCLDLCFESEARRQGKESCSPCGA